LRPNPLSEDARAIWQAGVAAVTPQQLFANKVHLEGSELWFDELSVDLRRFRRIVVVGAGKASAAMAAALETQVLSQLRGELSQIEITGWINCPQGAFTSQLEHIHLHAARPAGSNSPTAAGILGTERILELVRNCQPHDLVICLISGGGSALLVAPRDGVTLEDKQAVAELIAGAGGNIEQLNCVRRALSRVKGGGLARQCRGGELITLIISDVLGDPLEVIASGPTILSQSQPVASPLQVLDDLGLVGQRRLQPVVQYLRSMHDSGAEASPPPSTTRCAHVILGNNADAVDAAGIKAVELGYRYVMQAARKPEGDVLDVAHLATTASLQVMSQPEVDCWISGGEPTVALPSGECGKGGRNQQLALAVLEQLIAHGWPRRANLREIAFCSGGTDGEDGPTDAAGAWFDRQTFERMLQLELVPADYLRRADAYRFFEQVGGLLITGPTGTNVCDLRVGLAARCVSR
jgi:glycerate-2-kinase